MMSQLMMENEKGLLKEVLLEVEVDESTQKNSRFWFVERKTIDVFKNENTNKTFKVVSSRLNKK
jgi:hypothetical protein